MESKEEKGKTKGTDNPSHHEDLVDTGTEIKDDSPVGSPKPASELEAAQKEVLYLKAEFENTKRRLLREQESAIRFGNERVMSDLVMILDLMDRALGSSKPLRAKAEGNPLAGELLNFVTGIEMTQRELINLFGRFGVELTGAPGEKFDPARHEAVSELEASPEKSGTVLEVLQRGCLLHGRLLKPARVVVGKAQR